MTDNNKLPTDLSDTQMELVKMVIPNSVVSRLRKLSLESIVNALAYLVKTGCQWRMLPGCFPPPMSVYYHFRCWNDKGWFRILMGSLVYSRRIWTGRNPMPSVAVVDSQSVRANLPQSEKGVDGHKRVKGIKRHIGVDSQGNPLEVFVTKANVHDSRVGLPLIKSLVNKYPTIRLIKADKGYASVAGNLKGYGADVQIECVKSNFGTSDFIPMKGRWVVERTFSWLDNYRRLARNYEKYISTATGMTLLACSMLLLRHF